MHGFLKQTSFSFHLSHNLLVVVVLWLGAPLISDAQKLGGTGKELNEGRRLQAACRGHIGLHEAEGTCLHKYIHSDHHVGLYTEGFRQLVHSGGHALSLLFFPIL